MTIIGATHLLKYKRDEAQKRARERRTMPCYRKRRQVLSDLGYSSYADYLASDDWKRIRSRLLNRYPHCLLCKSPATQVHHLDYSRFTLLGVKSAMLVTLCSRCHEEIEWDGNTKRTLAEANKELRRRAHERGQQRWLTGLKDKRKSRRQMKRQERPGAWMKGRPAARRTPK